MVNKPSLSKISGWLVFLLCKCFYAKVDRSAKCGTTYIKAPLCKVAKRNRGY